MGDEKKVELQMVSIRLHFSEKKKDLEGKEWNNKAYNNTVTN